MDDVDLFYQKLLKFIEDQIYVVQMGNSLYQTILKTIQKKELLLTI